MIRNWNPGSPLKAQFCWDLCVDDATLMIHHPSEELKCMQGKELKKKKKKAQIVNVNRWQIIELGEEGDCPKLNSALMQKSATFCLQPVQVTCKL